MTLDLNTLFLVTIYVEAILGLLLLFAWVQNSQIRAVAWWGGAHLVRASSVVVFGMYGDVSDAISIDLANAMLFLAFAVTWTGARVFDGRPPLPMYIVAGPVIWIIVSHLPSFAGDLELRFLLASSIITILILFAHGSLFLLRTPLAAMLPWSPTTDVLESVWLTVLSFEALLFTISIAFILLAMAKERTEFRHKTAAMVDPLTGIANRRAFLQDATEMMRRNAARTCQSAVFLIDLDHFKSINDRFGHAIGDHVLQIFARTATETLRATDVIGRLGGEEFAALLCDVSRDKAVALAEEIRTSFAEATVEVHGYPAEATLSIGIVINTDGALELSDLLAQADHALYCAKENGRNRVEVATIDPLRAGKATPRLVTGMSAKSAA
jgi:diguanylate cyclase (GGDEF)-like protein